MTRTHIVIVDNVIGNKLGRKWALRNCVHEDLLLHSDFMTNYFRSGMTTDEYAEIISKFINEKGLRIVNEKPVPRMVDDRYAVDVYYTITW